MYDWFGHAWTMVAFAIGIVSILLLTFLVIIYT
jgi:hypothetical protein